MHKVKVTRGKKKKMISWKSLRKGEQYANKFRLPLVLEKISVQQKKQLSIAFGAILNNEKCIFFNF